MREVESMVKVAELASRRKNGRMAKMRGVEGIRLRIWFSLNYKIKKQIGTDYY